MTSRFRRPGAGGVARISGLARALSLVAGLVAVLSVSGCSVYMAATQPPKKDLAVLKPGTPRALVLAELGQPVASEVRDGFKMDVFAFQQGYSTGNKVTRAVWHFTADVFTAGLWEVVGTPAEAIFDGSEVKVEVNYDAKDDVRHVRAFSGAKLIGQTANVAAAPAPATAPAPLPAGQPAPAPSQPASVAAPQTASAAPAPVVAPQAPSADPTNRALWAPPAR